MKNILFTAYGYNDKDVSESFTSYCLTKQIDGHYDYTVYTKDAYVGKNVVNIKTVPFFQKLGYYRALKWDYFEFILKAYSQAKKDINNYDLIHHISPISFRYHNPLSKLDKPFIWGPVGGSLPYPKGFERIENKDSLVCKLRKMDTFRLKHDPILNSTMRRSERIVVTCRDAKRLIPEHYQEKTVVIPEGINIEPETSSGELDENYIFSSGRLVPYKALDLLIESFSKIKNQSHLHFCSF